MNDHYISSALEQHLEKVQAIILELNEACQVQLDKVQELLNSTSGSTGALDLAVQKQEEHINLKELELQDMCTESLLRFSPNARPFRFLSAAIYMGKDFERMGDEAEHVFFSLRDQLNTKPSSSEFIAAVSQLIKLCRSAQEDMVKALAQDDQALAQATIQGDQLINDLTIQATNRLIASEKPADEDSESFNRSLMEQFVVLRSLERYGDHIKNLCQDVLFVLTGDTERYKEIRSKSKRHN